MVYALRKLIAFVFLGGMFWWIYRDLDNLQNPVFMSTVGTIALVFFLFWFFVPLLVVRGRILKREHQNRERYENWCAAIAGKGAHPLRKRDPRLELAPGENLYFREKGTFYVEKRAGFEKETVPGSLGEVAFPGRWRNCRKAQRTHFYLTDQRILFSGKVLELAFPLDAVQACTVAPGGLVFSVARDEGPVRIAFTFQNPLITKHVYDFVMKTRKGESDDAGTQNL